MQHPTDQPKPAESHHEEQDRHRHGRQEGAEANADRTCQLRSLQNEAVHCHIRAAGIVPDDLREVGLSGRDVDQLAKRGKEHGDGNGELGLVEVYKNTCTLIHRFLDDARRALVDEKLSEVLRMTDREKRLEALVRIEDTLNEELWLMFNYHVRRVDRYHPDLQGVSADSFGWVDFSKLWVKSFVTSL